MANETLKVGDSVQIKTGLNTVRMGIEYIENDYAYCVWWNNLTHVFSRDKFPLLCLAKV